jgi:hypothetical protein
MPAASGVKKGKLMPVLKGGWAVAPAVAHSKAQKRG